MRIPESVTIVEVGARDGLQNIEDYIPAKDKIALVDALLDTGVSRIEVTSFVHPKAVPQLRDAEEVVRGMTKKAGIEYRAWVPNMVGARRAGDVGIDSLNMAVAASETFNRNNVRRNICESMEEFRMIANLARSSGRKAYASIATAFGCPFEGAVPGSRVARMADEFLESGACEIILCDTTGLANPMSVQRVLHDVMDRVPAEKIAVHFHNTRGAGLANTLAALDCGVTIIEASIGGLGGCPFAPGANGNIPTEDAADMLERMGVSTGLDIEALVACARMAERLVGKELPGQVMKAGNVCVGAAK